jgi:hypothetical protein
MDKVTTIKNRLYRDSRYLDFCYEMVIDELIQNRSIGLYPITKDQKIMFILNRLIHYRLLEIVVDL